MVFMNKNNIEYQLFCKLEEFYRLFFGFFFGEEGKYSAFGISSPKLSHII